MRHFLLIFLPLAVILTSCGGGTGGSPAPVGLQTPTPTPTASPTAAPTIAPQNYLPLSNSAGFESDAGSGISGPLASAYPAAPVCSSSIGTSGDFNLIYILVSNSTSNAAAARNGNLYQRPTYVISKNNTGDVIVVGYTFPGVGKVCTTPYPLMKSQVKAGDSWAYIDINGLPQTAVVSAIIPNASFTNPYGPHAGTTKTYSNVVPVSYGGNFVVYWAPNYGPAQIVNDVKLIVPGTSELVWTAYSYTVAPNSP